MLETIKRIYEFKYKELLIFSFLLLFICAGYLGFHYLQTGEFVQKSVSLKGGITATIPFESTKLGADEIAAQFTKEFPTAEIGIRTLTEAGRTKALLLETSEVDNKQLQDFLTRISAEKAYAIEQTGSSLGQRFYKQTIMAVVISFIAMSIVVYLSFRSLLPSLFVVLAALSDIISTLAVISFLEVKLSTAGIAAFLMLIGYSVDTDVLLTTRVLKQKEDTVFKRVLGAFRTGMLMTIASLAAVVAGYFLATSDTIKQIMLVIMIGLLFDIIYTWIQNAGILRWYLEKKQM